MFGEYTAASSPCACMQRCFTHPRTHVGEGVTVSAGCHMSHRPTTTHHTIQRQRKSFQFSWNTVKMKDRRKKRHPRTANDSFWPPYRYSVLFSRQFDTTPNLGYFRLPGPTEFWPQSTRLLGLPVGHHLTIQRCMAKRKSVSICPVL